LRVATLYDLLAPLYQRVLAPLHEVAYSRAAERGLEGGPASVLEVGIGPWRTVSRLSGGGRRVVGVDLSPRMLSLARAQVAAGQARASLARADVLKLPFRAGRFDAVVGTFVVDLLTEHDLPAAFAELTRVLSPGGRMVLGVMELPNRVVREAWMMAYRALPDLVGRCRPIDLSPYVRAQPLRVLREESVKGVIGMRVVTVVKAVG
jgi:ubiquinone/menaquinone biosynthesis C-methylase UbiE